MPRAKTHKNDPAVRLTQVLVRNPSVTAIDSKDKPASTACLDVLSYAATKSGASIKRLEFEGGHEKWDYPVENLYIEWTFGKGSKHLCYMGHLDVVPPGDEKKWSEKPYGGKIKDGYLYGRGVTDMKGSVAAFLSAIEENIETLKKDGDIRISMIVTMDEEWAAVNGSRKVLEWLSQTGNKPDAFIVGEPSSQDELGSHIKVGRRGSLCGTFNAVGVQGHAAYQDLFENPNRALTLAATIVNSHKWHDGNENFPDTNFEPIAIQAGNFNASAVIPGTSEMLWNIRFTPQQTPEGLERKIQDLLANPPAWAKGHPDAPLLAKIKVKANKDTASLPYYSPPNHLAAAAQDALNTVLGKRAKLDGSGGATDGRFAAVVFPDAEIIEMGLPEHGGIVQGNRPADYLTKGGMHQIDERAAVADLVNLKKIFKETVVNYDKQGTNARKPRKPGHSPHI